MKTIPSSAEAGRLDNTPKWDDIQVCIITGLHKLERELGPRETEKLRAARDQAYPPAQRIHDLAVTKAIMSQRVKALTEQRKLYERIMQGPY